MLPSKLNYIKEIRLQKLIETDYLANSDVTMPDNIKTWRQSLRDIPTNHTDEDAYDLLLAPIQSVINNVEAGRTDNNGIMGDFISGLAEATKELGLESLPYHAVAIRLRSRVWLILSPQNLRASSQRP